MPSYHDLSTAAQLIREVRESAPAGVKVACLIVDEARGKDTGWNPNEEAVIVELVSQVGAQMAVVSALRANQSFINEHEYVCVMDSDGEDAPQDVWRLITSLNDADSFILAERGERSARFFFKMSYRCFQGLHWIATGRVLRTGAFSVSRTSWLMHQINSSEFSYSYSGALLQLERHGARLRCDRQARRQGKSKMRIGKSVADGSRILMAQVVDIKRRWSKVLFAFLVLSVAFLGKSAYQLLAHGGSSLIQAATVLIGLFLVGLLMISIYGTLQLIEIIGGDVRSMTGIRKVELYSARSNDDFFDSGGESRRTD